MTADLADSVELHAGIGEIGRRDWDACASVSASRGNPFILYDYLEALEATKCASPRAGWGPRHLSLRTTDGRIAAVMPLYLKGHSQGEYVFDQAWAQAYEQAGGRYYPKLLCAAPFTPATGPRLLVADGVDAGAARSVLTTAALELCRRAGASSLHVNFPTGEEWAELGEAGFLLRQDQQYWFDNPGYGSFEDFLADLSSSRRKTIRRERRDAAAEVDIQVLTGGDLTEAHWDAFFAFYMDTGSRKWGRPYLNRAFFSLIGERMADRIALIMARRGGRWIAGALNFIGDDTLYGRQWGALESVPFLHFELCYYQAIQFGIERGLKRVEAGAQGEHKISRGYLPHAVYSAHWIADPALRAPVARYLDQERPAVETEMALLAEAYSPFRETE